jgi:Tctex-1 family
MSSVVAGGAQQYQLQPAYRKKASVNAMREVIAATLEQELKGQTYNGDTATQQTKKISDEIKNRLKALGLDRYVPCASSDWRAARRGCTHGLQMLLGLRHRCSCNRDLHQCE